MNKTNQTHLGQYLRSLRDIRGFENIHEYVQTYKLPVSYVYYTEIESGKKRVSLDTSKQLCDALKADVVSFYYHLLKDILPEGVQDNFLNLIPPHKVFDVAAQADKAQRIKEAYQKNQLSRLGSGIGHMGKEAEAYVLENPDLMLISAAIYCVPSTTETALQKVADATGITKPLSEILSQFEKFGIIKTSIGPNNEKVVTRVFDILVTKDQRVVAKRFDAETQYTLANPDGAVLFHGIVGLSKENRTKLAACIADLDAEFDAYHNKEPYGCPYLMNILFSTVEN